MTLQSQDILDLVEEIKQAKQQLVEAENHKEQLLTQYKQAADVHDQADRHYMCLVHVFEYCVHHDCDPAYAKLMLSQSQQPKSSSTHMSRCSMLQRLPDAAESPFARGLGSSSHYRTIKQKLVDWLHKS